ncbi:unnamed protein product [Acanthoscelides obtectus]|uniref:Uncharacterized protein n=1 Tax=Acanthoscelides obtectus TaxID=200917 RepID=A0A9P0JT51_ACAOB|nr:unnamed protein product [Acanthoscelides obtectus]CAK1625470.1 hypothetical protein AOBTE_LOCUS3180 [Acanthoscelides obtectus]
MYTYIRANGESPYGPPPPRRSKHVQAKALSSAGGERASSEQRSARYRGRARRAVATSDRRRADKGSRLTDTERPGPRRDDTDTGAADKADHTCYKLISEPCSSGITFYFYGFGRYHTIKDFL